MANSGKKNEAQVTKNIETGGNEGVLHNPVIETAEG